MIQATTALRQTLAAVARAVEIEDEAEREALDELCLATIDEMDIAAALQENDRQGVTPDSWQQMRELYDRADEASARRDDASDRFQRSLRSRRPVTHTRAPMRCIRARARARRTRTVVAAAKASSSDDGPGGDPEPPRRRASSSGGAS